MIPPTNIRTRLTILYALLTPAVVLVLERTAFTEILFAYPSSMANNGQNMAGLNASRVLYDLTTAVAMLVGALGFLPALALGPIAEALPH
jgi:K+-transporting ATPase A subunit